VSLGVEIAAGVALGFFVGNWLDGKFGWSPIASIVGAMVGLAGGMYLVIKAAMSLNDK
jgi:F0F1-type ATP synthase assembly protein I